MIWYASSLFQREACELTSRSVSTGKKKNNNFIELKGVQQHFR